MDNKVTINMGGYIGYTISNDGEFYTATTKCHNIKDCIGIARSPEKAVAFALRELAQELIIIQLNGTEK